MLAAVPVFKRHGPALGLFVFCAVVAFADVLPADRGLFYRDHQLTFRGHWQQVQKSLLNLELPVLGRASPGGIPMEQMFNGTYTPLTAILCVGPFDLTYDWFVWAHFVLLACGVYALSLLLGAARLEAILAAVVLTFAGPMISFESLQHALQGFAFMPWVLWALLLCLKSPGLLSAGLLALIFGFQLQCMSPIVFFTDLVGLTLVLAIALPKMAPELDVRFASRVLPWLGGALLVAFCLAAMVLVPVFWWVFPDSPRGTSFSYEETSGFALRPLQLVEFLVPVVWSPPDAPMLNLPEASGSVLIGLYLPSLYLGSVLSLLFAVRFERRRQWFLVLAVVFLVITAFGKATPLHRFVAMLPIIKKDRYAVKYLIPALLCLAPLSVLALRSLERSPRRVIYGAVASLIAGASAWQVVSSPELGMFLQENAMAFPFILHLEGVDLKRLDRLYVPSIHRHLWHVLLFGSGFLAAAALHLADTKRRELWRRLLVLMVALDLSFAARHLIFGAPIDEGRPPVEVMALVSGDRARTVVEIGGQSGHRVARNAPRTLFEDLTVSQRRRGGLEFLGLRTYYDEDFWARKSFFTRVYHLSTRPQDVELRQKIWERAGVSFVLSPVRYSDLELLDGYGVPGETGQNVHRVRGAHAYVQAYPRWLSMNSKDTSDAELIAFLKSSDGTETTLVLDDPHPPVSTSTACDSPKVTLLPSDDQRRIAAETEAGCEALVVAREPHVRGWAVKVDDEDSRLLHADLGFLGVVVPAGKHRVTFEYRALTDRTRWLGLFGLALALGAIGAGLLRARSPRG